MVTKPLETKKLINDNYCADACDGHCCHSYVVLITSEDALRILDNLDLHPYYFLDIYEASVENQDFYPKIMISSREAVLGIKYKPETIGCYFHDEKTGFCTVHKFKPMVCATYPFSMDWEGNLYHLDKILCPEKWWPESEEMKNFFRKVINKSWEENEIYKEKAAIWNDKHPDGTFAEFAKHIGVDSKKFEL